MKLCIGSKKLHKELPVLTTDMIDIDKKQTVRIVQLSKMHGREDEILYKTTEMHKNILSANQPK